jgi:hypothetical protein
MLRHVLRRKQTSCVNKATPPSCTADMVCVMSNDDSAGAGLPARLARRLMRSASTLAVAAAQRWAWSTVVVPVAVAVVAAVAYLVYRRGRHARLGAALDSVLVTADAVLDPEHTDAPAPRNPLRRGRHAIIQFLTRGAVARRRAAP